MKTNSKKKILFVKSSPIPNILALISFPNYISLYDINTNSYFLEIEIAPSKNIFFQIFAICFDDEGSQIFVAGNGISILQYDIKILNDYASGSGTLKFH